MTKYFQQLYAIRAIVGVYMNCPLHWEKAWKLSGLFYGKR